MNPLLAMLSVLAVAGLLSLHFYTRLRRLKAVVAGSNYSSHAFSSNAFSGNAFSGNAAPDRYRPMLRLLSDDDGAFVAANKSLARKLRKERSRIFREYLSYLSLDYGRLLAGVRAAMVSSSVDRPDLAAALARNQMLFALALCRIEYCLFLRDLGIGTVDVSGLVDALAVLRSQVQIFTPVTA